MSWIQSLKNFKIVIELDKTSKTRPCEMQLNCHTFKFLHGINIRKKLFHSFAKLKSGENSFAAYISCWWWCFIIIFFLVPVNLGLKIVIAFAKFSNHPYMNIINFTCTLSNFTILLLLQKRISLLLPPTATANNWKFIKHARCLNMTPPLKQQSSLWRWTFILVKRARASLFDLQKNADKTAQQTSFQLMQTALTIKLKYY